MRIISSLLAKERDGESGLNNFGARYYAAIAGGFMTPGWATRTTTVPYATSSDPRSLNLYTYVESRIFHASS